MEIVEFIFLAAVSLVLAAGLLWAREKIARPEPDRANEGSNQLPAVLLFQNGLLIDANAGGHALVQEVGDGADDWQAVAGFLKERFPDFPPIQGSQTDHSNRTFRARNAEDNALLVVEQWQGKARVSLHDSVSVPAHEPVPTKVSFDALAEAPYPIWQTDPDNRVTWANAAYKNLAGKLGLECSENLIPVVFEASLINGSSGPVRTAVSNPSHSQNHWFDVTNVRSENHVTHYATDANAIVNAEIAQRNFVQTLTKTFAQLSIGLAIFDRNRQLALFNPALIDLTALPADFLSSRPNLLSFFDRMRENRMMPEPRNYASWREQIAELVVAAADDRYTETWTLPSGVTYRVVGRPHPDGAIAFLFEDISAEVSLTRRFRADLEIGHRALDTIRDGMAVFSPTGNLGFCNLAFRSLWEIEPEAGLTEFSLQEALTHWRKLSEKSEAWEKLRHHVLDLDPRESWAAEIRMNSGMSLKLRVVSLSGGFTSVLFESPLLLDSTVSGPAEMMAG